ncbi:hypothetical protein IC235_18995 [Hymenobacter sp. BT664]|uniref:DUF4369 domain-containing protein n=1 Tax=Hymenobacter montanus TaxID=2771359 RepID=A0A927BH68_9BACT|nr:hypothetical protein [Hymenobacter montanus]MBD2769979.1 hypothetical protein [Hymenobacter montanus]
MRLLRFLSCALSLGAAALTACAPSYMLTMRPSKGTGLWADGAEAAHRQNDSLEVQVSFVRYEEDKMVFAMDFHNKTRRPWVVGPKDFYLQPVLTQPVASRAVSYLPAGLAAFDPEVQIQALTSRVSEESKAATNVGTNELLTSLSHGVENLAALKKKETKEQEQARETKHQNENNYYTRQRLEAAAAADQHRAQLEELRSTYLRRNTVEPGQRIRGYVSFPRADIADLIRVSAPGLAEGTTLDFIQTRVGPK